MHTTSILAILLVVFALGSCTKAPEQKDFAGSPAVFSERSGRIQIFHSNWYKEDSLVSDDVTVSELMKSKQEAFRSQKACIQNIWAKLASPVGDPNWNARRASRWMERTRQDRWTKDCVGAPAYRELPANRQPPNVREWFRLPVHLRQFICEESENESFEIDHATWAETQNGMIAELKSILAVTEQRVYAEVNWEFVAILEDKGKFGSNILDRWFAMPAHRKRLKDLLAAHDLNPANYRFRSWREKREQGSLQCVVARPKVEIGGRSGKVFR